MFERFTEPARQVVVLAQDEARTLEHNFIGTEHVLLGLLRVEDDIAAAALESLGVRIDDVRGQVARIVGSGEDVGAGQIPFTPRAKRVLDLGLREAVVLGHEHIGPEHLLLGLAREDDGVACRILLDHGANSQKVREEVIGRLGTTPPRDYDERMNAERRRAGRAGLKPYVPLIFGTVVMFGAAIGFGVLIGWAIWH
jgi:ATP-dependent Clp protease ATP-binding subunit ClpC